MKSHRELWLLKWRLVGQGRSHRCERADVQLHCGQKSVILTFLELRWCRRFRLCDTECFPNLYQENCNHCIWRCGRNHWMYTQFRKLQREPGNNTESNNTPAKWRVKRSTSFKNTHCLLRWWIVSLTKSQPRNYRLNVVNIIFIFDALNIQC